MAKQKHYLDRFPVKDWTISKDCEHIFLGTPEKKARMELIIKKHNMIVSGQTIKPFNLNIN